MPSRSRIDFRIPRASDGRTMLDSGMFTRQISCSRRSVIVLGSPVSAASRPQGSSADREILLTGWGLLKFAGPVPLIPTDLARSDAEIGRWLVRVEVCPPSPPGLYWKEGKGSE